MKKTSQLWILLGSIGLLCLLLFVVPDLAFAEDERSIDCAAVTSVLRYPFCAFQQLGTLTRFVLTWTIVASGLGCLFMFIYGAYQYISARDDSGQTEQGRSAMLWSAIGALLAASLFIFLRLLGTFVNVPIFALTPTTAYAQAEEPRIELVQLSGEVRSIKDGSLLQGTNITLHWFSPQGWVVWPAQEYENQRNPFVADVFGRYRFLVPPGSYYLVAERTGYLQTQTDILLMEEDTPLIVHIELEEGQLIWAYLLAAGWVVFIAAATYIIVVRILVWRKKQSLRTHLLEEIRHDSPEKLAAEHGTDRN